MKSSTFSNAHIVCVPVFRDMFTVGIRHNAVGNKHADHLYTSGIAGTPHVIDGQIVIQHPTHIKHTRI